MSISVTIYTDTAAEMNAEILRLAQRLEGPTFGVPVVGEPLGVGVEIVPEVEPTPEEPKRRTRRTKAEMQAAAAPVEAPSDVEQPTVIEDAGDPSEAAEPVAEEPAKVTMDDVRAALQRVAEKKDMVEAKNILAQVGAKRLSEVPEAKFAEFKALCDEAAA